jgi:uncharacterized protein YndB with AHSA1/START domain
MTIPDRELTALRIVRESIDIAASPEDVFQALTDPHELAAWLGGVDDFAAGEWRPDAAPCVSWSAPAIAPDGAAGLVRGEFLVVDAPRRLVSSWYASWDHSARTVVRYELEPVVVEGTPGTRLTVFHSAPAASAQRVSQLGAKRDSWTFMLARLAQLMTERVTV